MRKRRQRDDGLPTSLRWMSYALALLLVGNAAWVRIAGPERDPVGPRHRWIHLGQSVFG